MTPFSPRKHYVPAFPWDLDALPFVSMEDHASLPALRGIYFLRTSTDVLYVGASTHLQRRLAHHERLYFLSKIGLDVFIAWLPFPHAYDKVLIALEKQAIAYYGPSLNGFGASWWKKPEGRQIQLMETALRKTRDTLEHLLPTTSLAIEED